MEISSQQATWSSTQLAILQAKIIQEVEILRDALARIGSQVSPETERSLSRLNELDGARLTKALSDIQNFRELCQESMSTAEGAASNDRQLLWNTLRKLKAVPPSDIIDKIGSQDVIEIYNTEFIQIFRNLNYFDISSYTLIDVFTHQWDELYERADAHIGQQMMNVAVSVISGQAKTTFACPVDPHVLLERFSEEKLRLSMIPGFVSPLFDRDHQLVGAIFTSRVEILESIPESKATLKPQAERLRVLPELES